MVDSVQATDKRKWATYVTVELKRWNENGGSEKERDLGAGHWPTTRAGRDLSGSSLALLQARFIAQLFMSCMRERD